MQTSRFQMIRSRFSPSNLRTSLRRSSSASTATSSSNDMEEEKRRSGAELTVLEPRPIVYWGGLEERMGSL
ncbi:hypothetical protein F4679DRAFT_588212 [Xylaria curta]|nr:hypothetical protein F4679DRAFT_588212 [Xylaria curta]